MSKLMLPLAALALSFTFAGAAHAQNRPETEQCSVLRAMQWLDNGAPMDSAGRTMLDERERVACAAGLEAAGTEYWPNGVTFRAGATWYYPNGTTYSTGSAWYYPNGVTLAANGQWYDASGGTSSETGLLTTALSRLPRARGDELLGARSRPGTADFWRMIYLVAMVWESRT